MKAKAFHQRSFSRYISHVFYVYSEAAGAVFMLAGAALELACGAALGWDHPIAILAWHAADIFTVIALCMVWSIYRSELRFARLVAQQ
jgi:hypothetical protein